MSASQEPSTASGPAKRSKQMSQGEFIALIAMLFATIAFSLDAMLPAMTIMGQELSPAEPENATLVVGIFVLGMGIGTFFVGPLSDAYGRIRLILIGFLFYAVGALIAGLATDLNGVLIGRFLQGLAVAGPRIAGMALVRDLYSGERMAAIMSFAMTVFALVPAIAPSLGQVIMNAFGWRAIFFAFVGFAIVGSLWVYLRQAETLPPDRRRPLSARRVWEATVECFNDRVFRYSVFTQMMVYSAMFAIVSTVQPIYAQTYEMGDQFPLFFAASALISMPASFLNGKLVLRLGMRILIKTALVCIVALTVAALVIFLMGMMNVWIFFAWTTAVFLSIGFVFGNLNALALEPLGHIAGLAASISSAFATVVAAGFAMPISTSFDGTPLSLIIGVLIFEIVALLLMLRLGPRPKIAD